MFWLNFLAVAALVFSVLFIILFTFMPGHSYHYAGISMSLLIAYHLFEKAKQLHKEHCDE